MNILSYDIESVSGSHTDGSMCSFGFVKSDETFAVLEQKDLVMRPHTKRYATQIKLHYEKAYIKAQPKFPEFYEEIKSLFSWADVIIGFSVLNDVEFLNSACEVYGLEKIEYDFIDVQLLHKLVNGKQTMAGLEKLAEEMGLEYLAHRSDEDARLTLKVLKALCEKENLTIKDLLRKYGVTEGSNTKTEILPCTDGSYNKREKRHLILNFVEKHYKHNPRYKGGLSRKIFAFSDNVQFNDIDLFRRVVKKIYELNGRLAEVTTANVYVYNDKIDVKHQEIINDRNVKRERIKVIKLSELIEMLGELPSVDFSSDVAFIKQFRKDKKVKAELKRNQKGKLTQKITTS